MEHVSHDRPPRLDSRCGFENRKRRADCRPTLRGCSVAKRPDDREMPCRPLHGAGRPGPNVQRPQVLSECFVVSSSPSPGVAIALAKLIAQALALLDAPQRWCASVLVPSNGQWSSGEELETTTRLSTFQTSSSAGADLTTESMPRCSCHTLTLLPARSRAFH